jgi:general stress protein YciG
MQANLTDERTPDRTEELELTPDAPPTPVQAEPSRKPRGFAAMDRSLVRDIARSGGKAAHATGKAHEFTSDEARAAGRKGGQATHAKRRERLENKAPAEK